MTHTTQEQKNRAKNKKFLKIFGITVAAIILLLFIIAAISGSNEAETADNETADNTQQAEQQEPTPPEPTELPEGIDAQIAALTQQDGFKEAEVFYSEGDDSYPNTSVNIYMTVEPGWSESTMCRDARQHTINGLKFLRDNVNEPYDEAQFSFTADGEPDATGNTATLPMAHLVYEHDTIQAINDDTVTPDNVWDAADSGGKGIVCKRAED